MPTCWQGWLVLVGFIVLMVSGIPLVGSRYGQTAETAFIVGLIAAFLTVVLIKREPLWGVREGEMQRTEGERRLKRYAIVSNVTSITVIALAIPLALRWIPRNQWYGFRVPRELAPFLETVG
jgi:hypothetical protein